MENKEPFFSIVMPVYGVEKHLKKAISSVLDQTFRDFEMILVDDCSQDRCPEICDEFAATDDRIYVIHHEKNQGLSYARNSGLDIANGEYIWFMDSDDTVDDNLLELVHKSIIKNATDMVVIGLVEEYYDNNERLRHTEVVCTEGKILHTSNDVRNEIMLLEKKTLYGYAWNKFYRLEYLKNLGLHFEKITLIEDILFNVKYCMDIESMTIINTPAYHYKKRMDNSLTSKFVPDYYKLHQKRIELLYDQHQYWGICTEKNKAILASIYTRYIFSGLQRNCDKRSNMNTKKRIQWIKAIMEQKIFKELIPYGESDSKILSIMLKLLKKKRSISCVILGRIIFVVKNKLPMVFSKVKQKR